MMLRTEPEREGTMGLFLSKGMMSSSWAKGSLERKGRFLGGRAGESGGVLESLFAMVMVMGGFVGLGFGKGKPSIVWSVVSLVVLVWRVLSAGWMGVSWLGVMGERTDSRDDWCVRSGIGSVAARCTSGLRFCRGITRDVCVLGLVWVGWSVGV